MQPDGTRLLVRDGLSPEKTMATTMTELESSRHGSPAPSSAAVDDGYFGGGVMGRDQMQKREGMTNIYGLDMTGWLCQKSHRANADLAQLVDLIRQQTLPSSLKEELLERLRLILLNTTKIMAFAYEDDQDYWDTSDASCIIKEGQRGFEWLARKYEGRPSSDPMAAKGPLPHECILGREMAKYLSPTATVTYGVCYETLLGPVTCELVVEHAGYRIVFQVASDAQDTRLDRTNAVLLGSKRVDAIIRADGRQAETHLEDILYFASRTDPAIFTERSLVNLDRLVSVQMKTELERQQGLTSDTPLSILYDEPQSYDDTPDFVRILRWAQSLAAGQVPSWQGLYEKIMSGTTK